MIFHRFRPFPSISSPFATQALLNYTGGAFLYVKREFAGRIRVILRSWGIANRAFSLRKNGRETRRNEAKRHENRVKNHEKR